MRVRARVIAMILNGPIFERVPAKDKIDDLLWQWVMILGVR